MEAALIAAEPAGTQHLHFSYGPIAITPGQNNIAFSGKKVPKPTEAGYVLRIAPNLRLADGTVPPVDVLHLHHGVWLNRSHSDTTDPSLPERFFAAGEEKTTMELPTGFGYAYSPSDKWSINYMLHDLTPNPSSVSITYDIDFLPAAAPAAAPIRPAIPLWMDVQNGSAYPVFDVLKGSGSGGTYTYPDQATAPYGDGPALNEWKVDRDLVLLATGGHLHPGGLHDDLAVDRPGAGQAHLFESDTTYYEPAGAVSWDVAMKVTDPDWRVAVHPGDTLRVSATYDTTRASWYESMGIMVTWATAGTDGPDPFTTKVDVGGHLTHGHLAENDNHGGGGVVETKATAALTPVPASGPIPIDDFTYVQGDRTLPQSTTVPVISAGQSLTFVNNDNALPNPVWHTITACKEPCDQATGIAYPLADTDVPLDSGQLGTGGPPTAGTTTWSTPTDLAAGTYAYFCRIHPFMRGSFVVTP